MSLLQVQHPLASSDAQRRLLLDGAPGTMPFSQALARSGLFPLRATGVEVLQVNVGKFCNQSCGHCHVDAGPDRTEVMPVAIAEQCLGVLAEHDIPTLDITGGAPELSPVFRLLVQRAHAMDRRVIDRCNLTVLLVASHADLPEFLASHRVEIIASLPYYLAEPTDAQRGPNVFSRSIEAIRRLNALGYGDPASGLTLNLVYNPTGAFLPPRQSAIESDFRRELARRYDVRFNALYTIANMPIGRFLEFLERSGNLDRYLDTLVASYNEAAAGRVMCRQTLSVGWDGTLYDCDFNQMLNMPLRSSLPRDIGSFSADRLERREIAVGPHCYGCTAGSGSSCGGATV